MLNNFLKAQLRNPSKGDWVHLIKSDLNDFKINENLEQISKLGKNKFKKKVAIACKQDQGSIAPSAVHPIDFHNVQVFLQYEYCCRN